MYELLDYYLPMYLANRVNKASLKRSRTYSKLMKSTKFTVSRLSSDRAQGAVAHDLSHHALKTRGGVEIQLHTTYTYAPDGCGRSVSRPGHCGREKHA
jgi:hypothetical protein